MSYIDSAGVKLNKNADLIIEAQPSGAVTSCRDAVTGTEYVGGGGGGIGELVYEAEFTANTTSTSAVNVYTDSDNWPAPETNTIYMWIIKDMNKVIPGSSRKFVCSSGFIYINTDNTTATSKLVDLFRLYENGDLVTTNTKIASGNFGVYVRDFSTYISVGARYDATYSGVINSNFKLEVYKILNCNELIGE